MNINIRVDDDLYKENKENDKNVDDEDEDEEALLCFLLSARESLSKSFLFDND